MKKLAAFATTGVLLLALGGCASSGDTENTGAAAATAAIDAANAALAKARAEGGEWRDAKKKFLKKAKAAAHKGDYETAIKLANKAKFQGEMGLAQALEQKDAKPWLF